MPRRINCILLVVAALAACATVPAPRHESMADPGTNLAAYRTFGWRAALADGAGDAPLRMLDVNIQDAIRAELTGRGYVEDSANPQFLVTYETAFTEKVKSNPVRVGIGMGGFSGNVGGSVSTSSPSLKNYREGELVVHVIDAAANREVWYGTVAGEMNSKPLDAATVARGVAIALQDFPKRATTTPAAPPAPAAP